MLGCSAQATTSASKLSCKPEKKWAAVRLSQPIFFLSRLHLCEMVETSDILSASVLE
jgi:hypothetical protein